MPSTNGHGPQRAILYARVSTDEQARSGYSLRQQIDRLREYAADEGYEVLEEVADAGYSGASLGRPGMDRVRDLVASEAGGVSVVLAQDRDRFAREPAFVYLLREEFAENGCKLRSLNDRGDDSPEGELTDGILDQLAKFERAKMMERTRRGKQRKAHEGRITTTRAAFGFDYNATRDGYVINPEQMEVVRRIFYMAGVEKTTIYAIRQDLERRGLRTPSGKAGWDHSFIRGFLVNDLYKPHTFEEIRRIVSAEVAARLDPEARYGVWWSGRKAFERKLVSKNSPNGRHYKYRYKVKERAPEERIGVPVPDSGIPREWVDAAREAIKNNRRPARAGDRKWDLSGGILRCAECGRAMSARTFPKPGIKRTYFYYVCVAGAPHKPNACSARKHHKAEEVETWVWDAVSGILKDPQRLRAGLDYMIEQESCGVYGDPAAETERWLEEISEAGRKRARYQEMAAEGLIEFEELRARLAALEDTRKTAERELRNLEARTEHLVQLERDRDSLLENYADLMPEAIAALGSEERHRVYRMIGMEAHLAPDGSLEVSGNVMNFSKLEISSA
jgi:site-specific DNA recombinase